MNVKRDKHPITLQTLIACAAILLSGCQNARHTVPQDAHTADNDSGQTQTTRLNQCQQALDALEDIQPQQYATFHQEFDRLMSGAAQYAALRNRVTEETQETVDALYRYKVNRLCANILQATLTGLAERAEQQQ
ncbi:hypothetical protein [Serratia rubidaea]|uniref:Lipoprotein n=1 Tax=Serratia rubidaea TaxID=61652 RepID=A0A3S4WU84_SERRU|nr:hypothetical protein [Serratia rubidaea]MDC6117548.1 hypothetical protein [Serratia rubidaea]MEB7586072.1 hypothetical protein [Serratia rubidaea]VEI65615.1 Uncharacterised protein [Serratia rubidaea]